MRLREHPCLCARTDTSVQRNPVWIYNASDANDINHIHVAVHVYMPREPAFRTVTPVGAWHPCLSFPGILCDAHRGGDVRREDDARVIGNALGVASIL